MRYLVLVSFVIVAGCDQIRNGTGSLFGGNRPPQDAAITEAAATETEGPPVEAAETTDNFDPGWVGAKQTVAGLGDISVPGVWLETPLVSYERSGRVVLRKTGASAFVTLIPIDGEEGAGSRLSLDAMRALLAPIDQLVELDVYTN